VSAPRWCRVCGIRHDPLASRVLAFDRVVDARDLVCTACFKTFDAWCVARKFNPRPRPVREWEDPGTFIDCTRPYVQVAFDEWLSARPVLTTAP